MRVHILHIPKTGGISCFRALQAAGVDVTRSHDPSECAKLPPNTLIVSLLRNPVDRVWSAYRYYQHKGMFDGDLRAFLEREPEVWWWGVRNVQSRYLRPGVLYDTTPNVNRLVCTVCELVGVDAPTENEWHGRDTEPKYTVEQYAAIAAVCGDGFYGEMAQRW